MNHQKRYRFESLFCLILIFGVIIARGPFGYSETPPSEHNLEQEVEKVHEGGTLTVTCPEHVQTLDPQKAELLSEKWVIEQIYDGLYEYDPNDQIVPELAADFPEKLGEYEYLVRLKPGIKFSDGTDMDANDVAFTFKRLLNPTTQCPTRALFQNLKHIEAITSRTVKITVGPDCPDLLELLSRTEARPVSRKAVKHFGERFGQVVSIGTGPFRMVEWDRENELVLLRNEAYKIRQPFLYRIVFRFPRSGINLLRELRLARIELVSDISTKNASKLSSHPAYRVEHKAGQRICQIYLNAEQYPLDRAGIRKAILLGIDKKDIVDKVFNGFATPAESCTPQWHPYYDPNVDIYHYDPSQALKILAGEGFTSEFPVSFSLMYTDAEPFKAIAELIMAQLAQIGVQVHLVPLDKKDLFDYVYGRAGRDRALFQAALEDWEDWRGGGGIEQFTWRLYHSSSPENKLGAATYPWEEVLAMATKACDPGTRKDLFINSIRQIDQSLITIYLCYPHRIWAARKWVNGRLCNSLGHLFLDRIWVR